MNLASKIVKRACAGMFVLTLAFGGVANAQDYSKEHVAAAKAALEAIGETARLDNILPEVANFTKAGLIANRPDIETEISAIVDEVAISLASRRGALENEVANIYAAKFSADELNAIAEFFNSDVGKKFNSTGVAVSTQVDQAARLWQSGINRDMGNQVREKLKERGLQ